MNVERYLGKYGGPVFTVSPNTTVAETARRFGHHISGKRYSVAVVVNEEDGVVGIVSLGDITHCLGQHEEKAPTMLVGDIMTTDVHICGPNAVVEDVLKEMADKGIRHTPVVQGGKLGGLLARREALEFLYQWAQVDVDHLTEWLFSSHARY